MCPYWNVGGLAAIIGMLVFWGAVIFGLYLLYRIFTQRGMVGAAGPNTPRAILDRRLAAGEITSEEYDTLRNKLEGP